MSHLSFRNIVAFFLTLACLYQTNTDALLREYGSSYPELCADHMQKYQRRGSLVFNFSAIKDDFALIPKTSNFCNHCECIECHQAWWREWALNDDDTDFFWICRCKSEIEDVGWDETWDSWEFCDRGAMYPGYVNPRFQSYSSLLGDHLSYVKLNKNCQCHWPESSQQAAAISDLAYRLFFRLLEETQLGILWQNSTEQNRFLSLPGDNFLSEHGFTVALIAHCFFYSHYECVIEDLEAYSQRNFATEYHLIICDRLNDIRDSLCPLFLKLYDECLSKHSNQRLLQEREYLLSKLGYDTEFDSYHFDNGALTVVFSRDDNSADTMMASLNVNESPLPSECMATSQNAFVRLDNKNTLFSPLHVTRPYALRVHSNYHLQRGIILSDQLRYAEAIAAFSQALHIDPSNSKVFIERAGAYWESDRIELALSDHEQWTSMQKPELRKLSVTQEDIECAGGLCVGISKGTSVSAIEFISSTLRSLKGLGVGLWAFAKNPITVSEDFMNSMYEIVYFLRYDATPNMLIDSIPELKQLVNTWPNLSYFQKGEQFGFILGKYGIEIFGGAGSLKIINKYRQLKNANTALTLECCRISAEQRALVVAQAAQRQITRREILKSAVLKIQVDKQNKHVIGSKNYIERRSVLTHKDPQSLINRLAGTGRASNSVYPGQPGYREVVDCGEIIGYSLKKDPITPLPTKFGTIHYAKDGTHIVPHVPMDH